MDLEIDHKNNETVYICDEFDYMIETQSVVFEADNKVSSLRGLAQVYNSNKVYFMSATFDNY